MAVRPGLEERTVEGLSIHGERSFRAIAVYADLKEILRRHEYVFRVLPPSPSRPPRWDRALLLNLTYWSGRGGDILESDNIAADVIAHAAWHHLAALALATKPAKLGKTPSAAALLLGESIASAFDAYVVGRQLACAPGSPFLKTQVPAMAETARAAGLSARGFRKLLLGMADDPARSFADLREMLYDAALGLVASTGAAQALAVLDRASRHRFGPLLHHYELSNWVLYARTYARNTRAGDRRAGAVDRALRGSPLPLDWLKTHWVSPALRRPEAQKVRGRH